MANDIEFEEEEFTTQFNGRTFVRILALTRPHWPWVVGFLLTVAAVSAMDSYFTYLSARIVDEGIIAGNRAALLDIMTIYGVLIFVQAVGVFGFIYLTGVLGERVRYDLRKRMFDHLQGLSFTYFDRTPVGWIMARVTSDSGRIAGIRKEVEAEELNPRDAKEMLAREVVEIYHGNEEAEAAAAEFRRVFSDKQMPTDIAVSALKASDYPEGRIWVVDLMTSLGLASSKGEARRLIAGGGVTIDGERVADEDLELPLEQLDGVVLRRGRKRFVQVEINRGQ